MPDMRSLIMLVEDARQDRRDNESAEREGNRFWRELVPHYSNRDPEGPPPPSSWPPSAADMAVIERDIMQRPEWMAVYASNGWRNWTVAQDWHFWKKEVVFAFKNVPSIGYVRGKLFPDRETLYLDLEGRQVANPFRSSPRVHEEYYRFLPNAIAACRAMLAGKSRAIRANLPFLTGSYYVRFGGWPTDERSRNWLFKDQVVRELGVSAYHAEFDIRTGRWELETVDEAATNGTMQSLFYDKQREIFLVQGTELGEVGSDGEPLLHHLKVIKKLKPDEIAVSGMFDHDDED